MWFYQESGLKGSLHELYSQVVKQEGKVPHYIRLYCLTFDRENSGYCT